MVTKIFCSVQNDPALERFLLLRTVRDLLCEYPVVQDPTSLPQVCYSTTEALEREVQEMLDVDAIAKAVSMDQQSFQIKFMCQSVVFSIEAIRLSV